MRTRRKNKEENKKTKKMCERLNRAEEVRDRPMIEGELPDMPESVVDDDYEEGQGKRVSKKDAAKEQTEEQKKAAEIALKTKQVSSLFEKFNLGAKLTEIEVAEREDDFEKIV